MGLFRNLSVTLKKYTSYFSPDFFSSRQCRMEQPRVFSRRAHPYSSTPVGEYQ